MKGTRHPVRATGLLLLLVACLLLLLTVDGGQVNAEKPPLDCSYCRSRGFPYLCHATMASGICFVNSGDMRCEGEKGCECCRTTNAAGCSLCSMEADWDAYDDEEEDI